MAPWLIAVIAVVGLAALVFGARVVVSSLARRRDRQQLVWGESPPPGQSVSSTERVSIDSRVRRVRRAEKAATMGITREEEEAPAPVSAEMESMAPVEEEAPTPATPEVRSEAPVQEEPPAPVRPPVRSAAPVEEQVPTPVRPPVVDRVVIPRRQEAYKEERMDGNYVVRNDNEARVVQMLHPDCSLTIPTDYEGAIETMKGCPLTCPYRIVEFAELDQEMLRRRTR